jgi:hypothetical protein
MGGIMGAVLGLLFTHYWFHSFSEITSTIIIMALPLTGERVAAAMVKKGGK